MAVKKKQREYYIVPLGCANNDNVFEWGSSCVALVMPLSASHFQSSPTSYNNNNNYYYYYYNYNEQKR